MRITVIICTYNRAESLKKTLNSLLEMTVPDNLSWELLIIDNNSRDHTRNMVKEFMVDLRLPVRYIFEEKQGQSHARNRGIREAYGEIIAFTDDDVIVEKEWVLNIKKAFEKNNVACVGGKILPIWEIPKPNWLTQDLYSYLGLLDYGDRSFYLDSPKIWGANFAVKSLVFQKYGYFDTTLGHKGGKLYGGEEVEFIAKLISGGENVFYCPNKIVYHCIPAKRMRKSYFRKWFYDKGELEAIQMGYYPYRNFMGIPLYRIKWFLKEIHKYFRVRIFNHKNEFIYQLNLVKEIGFIMGRLKYNSAVRTTKK